ncbi:MAG: hypothetical protein ACP5JC_04835, partial [Candidatus Micrarchaeia archaeon]
MWRKHNGALASPVVPHEAGEGSVKRRLTIQRLCKEAKLFSEQESSCYEPSLYGVTDGKAVGTHLEQKFRAHLSAKYEFLQGSSGKGIDFPELLVDVKVTSIRQPQSSSPFKSARQKIFGLGYSLLVFIYDKFDDPDASAARLSILHTIFVDKERTGDYQTTSGILKILENKGNEDDIIAFLQERMLPIDEIQAAEIAQELLHTPPQVGYLTISNALQ